MMKNWLGLLVMSLGILLPPASMATEVIVYTEEYPPYNYAGANGEVLGLATEKVRQVLDATGFDYTIKLVPWSRAMLYASTQENALIYTLTRIPSRERRFDWLVPLAKSNFYLFTRADEQRAVTPEALRAGEFTGACVSADLTCDLLDSTGIPQRNIIQISDSATGDFRLVVAGRADLYISELAVNARLRREGGFNSNVTKPVMQLSEKVGFYLAGNRKVAEEIRNRVRDSYEQLVAKGSYQLLGSKKTEQ